MGWVLIVIVVIFMIWFFLELIVRMIAENGFRADFYGSISRDEVREFQARFGIKVMKGPGWYHLGWIADPERETYEIERRKNDNLWVTDGQSTFGSWLAEYSGSSGDVRVFAVDRQTGRKRIIGELSSWKQLETENLDGPLIPEIAGEWNIFFKPERAGNYINDHCLYRDGDGDWRLVGITAHGRGDYKAEKHFAVGYASKFPPEDGFREDDPIADFNEIAWAPEVIKHEGEFHLFWSPQQLHHMVSDDGVNWHNHEIIMDPPFHKFFRDAVIFQIGPDQWLLYATSRGRWFSRVDLYQSFDLIHWQYIRPALRGFWGSEKNFVTGSMESPFLIHQGHRYYLSITYNNESFFWSAVLLQLKIFLRKEDYNNTLIFQSETPYDFGVYNGQRHAQTLVTKLAAHAPVYLAHEGQWYITTCGWPFAATLTDGEVAWARLVWRKRKD